MENIILENGQSAASKLNNQQLQVLLTGAFGDGTYIPNSAAVKYPNMKFNYHYGTSCLYKEYVQYKKELLGDLCRVDVSCSKNTGYKKGTIYKLYTRCSPAITELALTPPEYLLQKMDSLGLALWFYDDGSKHHEDDFYNLNTQKYSREFHEDVIVPFLKEHFDIKATPTIERKKNGRCYWYLRIGKYDGAFIVSDILRQYYIPCYDYKLISSETSQKWRKLQEELKSTNTDINTLHRHTLGNMLKQISV